MENVRFSEGITEVVEILKMIDEVYTETLPGKFKKFLNDNKSTSYKPDFDHTKELKDWNIKEETKNLLGIIYLNYWATEDEKNEYMKLLSGNEKKYQKVINEKYNTDNLFRKKQKVTKLENKAENNMEMIEKKESFWKKIIRNIKNFFKLNQ